VYRFAILDWARRRVLAWRLSDTLTTDFCVETVQEAISRYGPPEIFNTDQGCQGGFNRSTQHWVVRRIVGTCLGLRLVSSNQASSAVWC
jgi:transposase InsO family protein